MVCPGDDVLSMGLKFPSAPPILPPAPIYLHWSKGREERKVVGWGLVEG